jgi:hypothetical protein
MTTASTTAAVMLLAVFPVAAGSGSEVRGPDPLAERVRPRLLLTAERLEELRRLRHTTHREAWAVAKGEADAMLGVPLPADRSKAHNAYRNHGKMLAGLALAYRVTGERAYLDAARRWLTALVRFDSWDGSAHLGRASFATGVSLAYDWLYDELEAAERAEIRARLLKEGAILHEALGRTPRLLSNHCHNELCGLAMIGYTLWGDAAEAEAFARRAEEVAGQMLEHAPLDGAWSEGVSYWGYGHSYFLRMLEAKRLLGRGDEFARSDFLRRTGDYFLYLSLPEAHWKRGTVVFNIADSPLHGGAHTGPILRRLASAYGNGVYQHLADALMPLERTSEFPGGGRAEPHGAWLHFLWYDPGVKPIGPDALPTFKHFTDMDLVTTRSGWDSDAVALAFHCGPGPGHRNMADPRRIEMNGFGPGHAHPDINAFSIFARGEWLAVDPGYARVKQTRDHSTVIVNGEGQAGEGSEWLDYMAFQSRQPTPAITRAESNPVYDSVIGDAGNIYKDAARLRRFRRQILFLKPDTFVVADELATSGPSRFEWLLHAPEKSLSVAPDGAFVVSRGRARLSVRWLRPADASARVISRPTGSDGFDPTDCLVVQKEGVETFPALAVLTVLAEGEAPPRVSLEGDRLRVDRGQRRWIVRVRAEGGTAADALLELTEPPPPREGAYRFVRSAP